MAQPTCLDTAPHIEITAADRAAMKAQARRLATHCEAFRGARTGPAILQIVTTAVPFFALVALMYVALPYSYLLTLLLAIPASGLLVRFFIIQHDCGHNSFLPWPAVNDAIGRAISIFSLTPYGMWRRIHARHHATAGNLDRRGYGDINTLTVDEYRERTPWRKFTYRLYRHPLFLFPIGVPFFFVVLQRLPWGHPMAFRDAWRSVLGLNIAIVIFYGLLGWYIGYVNLLLIALPMIAFASAIGGWLFFIQHQFDHAHWDEAKEWDFQVAALQGSSYYALPKPVAWLTGDIGIHHIHHLNSLIPNYRLQECLDSSPELSQMNRITFWESLKCARLVLWDTSQRKLLTFREAARLAPAAA